MYEFEILKYFALWSWIKISVIIKYIYCLAYHSNLFWADRYQFNNTYIENNIKYRSLRIYIFLPKF